MSQFNNTYEDGVYYDEKGDQFVTISGDGEDVVLRHCESGNKLETFPKHRFDSEAFTKMRKKVVEDPDKFGRELLTSNTEYPGKYQDKGVLKYIARFSSLAE